MKLYSYLFAFIESYRRFRLLIPFLFVAFLSQGCFLHYYKTNTAVEVKADTLGKLAKHEKYFILHDSSKVYALENVRVSDSSIDGNLDSVLTVHRTSLHPLTPTHNRFIAKNAEFVLNEIHIYTKTEIEYVSEVHIPLKNIRRIDIYDLDRKSTNKSRAYSIVGLTLGTGAAFLVVVGILLSSSQPLVIGTLHP
jgi:hypothetical protein